MFTQPLHIFLIMDIGINQMLSWEQNLPSTSWQKKSSVKLLLFFLSFPFQLHFWEFTTHLLLLITTSLNNNSNNTSWLAGSSRFRPNATRWNRTTFYLNHTTNNLYYSLIFVFISYPFFMLFFLHLLCIII